MPTRVYIFARPIPIQFLCEHNAMLGNDFVCNTLEHQSFMVSIYGKYTILEQ